MGPGPVLLQAPFALIRSPWRRALWPCWPLPEESPMGLGPVALLASLPRGEPHGAGPSAQTGLLCPALTAMGPGSCTGKALEAGQRGPARPRPGPMVLSSGERGTGRAEGQAPQCSAQGKEALHQPRKMNVLLPSSTGFLPALPAPALVLAFLLPNLESTRLCQMGTVSSPAPLIATATPLPSHAFCRTSPSIAPLRCE